MLPLLESDVQEAIGRFHSIVNIGHLRVTREYLFAVHKQGNCRLFPKLHSFANYCVELNCLEVIWNQKPKRAKRRTFIFYEQSDSFFQGGK